MARLEFRVGPRWGDARGDPSSPTASETTQGHDQACFGRYATIPRNLERFRGHEVKTNGDGFLATFEGPGRAVRCACAIAEDIRTLGIEIRAGLRGRCSSSFYRLSVQRRDQ